MSQLRVIHPAVAATVAPRLKLGLVAAAPVLIGPNSAGLAAEIEHTCNHLRETYGTAEPASISGLKAAREPRSRTY